MPYNKRKSVLDTENRTSKDKDEDMARKLAYQNELANQIAERKAQELAKKEEEDKLQRQFEEMNKNMEDQMKVHIERARSMYTKKDPINEVFNSNANCINTALSKNYVLKHKETADYNTLTDTTVIKPDLIRNDSSKHFRLKQLRERLKEAKDKAFEALDTKEKSEARLFELKAQLKRMQQEKDGYMVKLKAALNRNKLDDTSNVFLCETDFIPVDNKTVTENAPINEPARNSLHGKPLYGNNNKIRGGSARRNTDRCDKEIIELQGLIDNYYRH